MSCRTRKPCAERNSIMLRKLRVRIPAVLLILAVYFLVSLGAKFIGVRTSERPHVEAAAGGVRKEFFAGRHLLDVTNDNVSSHPTRDINCTEPAIDDFPLDYFSDEQRRNGAAILHAFLAIYLLTLLGTVCDDYFVPSIKRITRVFHISKDVAGATFMAAATSSPELFINSVGTFVTEGDIGIGTIVGSGVFNILAVPACCGLIAGKSLSLDWWPLTRDSIAYGVAVTILILTMADGQISWQEALILVGSYIAYILIMCYNGRIEKWAQRCKSKSVNSEAEEARLLSEESPGASGQIPCWSQKNSDNESESDSSEDEDNKDINQCHWPENQGKLVKAWWIFTWPISSLLKMTIPNCRQPSKQHLYAITFIMCVFYIGSASYMIAWMITVIGDAARIPDSVMGLTFLAAGTSLPEAVSSVIVTSQGYGSMGLSNSLGSNTFDILLCLGFPWLIKSLFFSTIPGYHFVIINSKGIEYSAITLLSTLLIMYISFAWNSFKLNRKVGLTCLIVYITFLIGSTLNELNFFYPVNMPTCGW